MEESIDWEQLADLIDKATQINQNDLTHYEMVMHPWLYNGGWWVKRRRWSWRNRKFARVFRWLGRKLKSRGIYWLGYPVEWFAGIKNWKIEYDKKGLILTKEE